MIHWTLVLPQCLQKWLKGKYPTDSHSLTFIVPKRPKCCFLLTWLNESDGKRTNKDERGVEEKVKSVLSK